MVTSSYNFQKTARNSRITKPYFAPYNDSKSNIMTLVSKLYKNKGFVLRFCANKSFRFDCTMFCIIFQFLIKSTSFDHLFFSCEKRRGRGINLILSSLNKYVLKNRVYQSEFDNKHLPLISIHLKTWKKKENW